MSGSVETFQLSVDAAEVYEARFVPALFAEWAPHLLQAAGVAPGHRVLDVACGTGVVARVAAEKVGDVGTVTGVDLSEGMLTVARRIRPDIDWRQADAAALPFPDGSFDVVLCQAALMFFPDRAGALREMARVARVPGTVAVQVWADLASQPAYGPFVEAAAKHAGPEAIDLLGAYWALGDLDLLASLFEAAGLAITGTRTRLGTAAFGSIDEVVRTEVEGSPLKDRLTDEVYEAILRESREVLAPFRTPDGAAAIPIRGHIITARRR